MFVMVQISRGNLFPRLVAATATVQLPHSLYPDLGPAAKYGEAIDGLKNEKLKF